MSQANVEVIRNLYAAFEQGDVQAVLGAMDPGIVWNEAENHIYAGGNPYVGPGVIAEGIFLRVVTEWEGFQVVPAEFLDAGDTVVALGRYKGVNKATGKPLDAQFAHVWRVAGGRATSFQQYTDTAQFRETCA